MSESLNEKWKQEQRLPFNFSKMPHGRFEQAALLQRVYRQFHKNSYTGEIIMDNTVSTTV